MRHHVPCLCIYHYDVFCETGFCLNIFVLLEFIHLGISCGHLESIATMSSSQHSVSVSKLMQLLHEWDSGSKSIRRRLLQDFIAQNQNKTAPELDAEFADAASLFLARLLAWLRLTYPLHWSVKLYLKKLMDFSTYSLSVLQMYVTNIFY